MFDSTALEVVVGLVFVYLLFSLFCTALQEVIAGWQRRRALFLKKGVHQLLHDPDGVGLAGAFCAHPLIVPLLERNGRGFSYLAPRTFALVLMDLLASRERVRSLVEKTLPSDQWDSVVAALTDRQKAPNEAVLQQLASIVDHPSGAGFTPHPQSLAALRSELYVRKAVNALWYDPTLDPNGTQANIESWFNEAMKRVSGWYKRWAQIQLTVIALVLVVLANADTIRIAHFLSRNASVRGALNAAAKAEASKPVFYTAPPQTPSVFPTAPGDDPATAQAARQFGAVLGEFVVLPLPLGWFPPEVADLTPTNKEIGAPSQPAAGAENQPATEQVDQVVEALLKTEPSLSASQKDAYTKAAVAKAATLRQTAIEAVLRAKFTSTPPSAPAADDPLVKELAKAETARLGWTKAASDAAALMAVETANDRQAMERQRAEASRREVLTALIQDPKRMPKTDGSDAAFMGWIEKIVGLALTVLACTLGAPFWFDLLSRFVNIRVAGPPPVAAPASTGPPVPAPSAPAPPAGT